MHVESFTETLPAPQAQDGRRITLPARAVAPISGDLFVSSADDADGTLSLSSLTAALRRWWTMTLPAGVLLAVAAVGYLWWTFVPVYRAIGWLRIESDRPHIAFRDEIRYGSAAPFVATQVELMRHPLILEKVIGRARLDRDASGQPRDIASMIEALRLKLGVTPVGNSELFEITYESIDPEESALVVNSVLDSFMEFQEQVSGSRNQRMIELLEEEKTRRSTELESLRTRLRELAKSAGQDLAISPTGDMRLVASPEGGLQQRLAALEVEQEMLKAQSRVHQELMSQGQVEVPAAAVDAALEQAPQIKRLQELVAMKREQMLSAEMVSRNREHDPVLKRLRDEIAQHERYKETIREQLRGTAVARVEQQQLEKQREELRQMQLRLDANALLIDSLRKQLEEERTVEPGEDRPERTEPLQVEFARADLARAEEVYERITARAEALRTETKAPSQVSTLSRAIAPSKPVEQMPWAKMVAAALAGLSFPFGLALVWERIVRRIAEPQQIVSDVRLNVLGEVAAMPNRPVLTRERDNGRMARHLSRFQESIEYVRTNLVVTETLEQVQVLVVASAVSQEGKTSLASNLAVSVSRVTPGQTLLIDADMRSPDLHGQFEVPLGPGLADVLDGRATADEAIVPWSERLHFMPAGHLQTSPHVLLSRGGFGDLIASLRDRYRYIIVDAPPVLPVSDTLLLARACDGTLISVMRNVSRTPLVKQAVERLNKGGVRVLGAVLSGVPSSGYAYAYGSSDGHERSGQNDMAAR